MLNMIIIFPPELRCEIMDRKVLGQNTVTFEHLFNIKKKSPLSISELLWAAQGLNRQINKKTYCLRPQLPPVQRYKKAFTYTIKLYHKCYLAPVCMLHVCNMCIFFNIRTHSCFLSFTWCFYLIPPVLTSLGFVSASPPQFHIQLNQPWDSSSSIFIPGR